jgi:hypothetical protein
LLLYRGQFLMNRSPCSSLTAPNFVRKKFRYESNNINLNFHWGNEARARSWPLTSIQCRGREWWSYTSTPHTSSWRGI